MTNEEMVKRIKSLLGWPSIDLETSDEQITACIDNAILIAKDHISTRRYKSYNVGPAVDAVIPRKSYKIDLKELEFDEITEVYRGDSLSPYLYDGFYLMNYAVRGVPASYAMAINAISNLDALINRSWRVIDKTLYLDKYYGAVTIEFIPKTIGLEDIEDTYWLGWIQRYALALTKEMLGRIRGKFTVDSEPVHTDADALLSEASSEKTSLLEEIQNKGLLMIMR